MTPQKKMESTLAKSGIPAKEIKVFGNQIIITAWSRDAAAKWADLLGRFARVRGVIQSRDYDKRNQNTVLRPSTHIVWRIGAVI